MGWGEHASHYATDAVAMHRSRFIFYIIFNGWFRNMTRGEVHWTKLYVWSRLLINSELLLPTETH